MEPIEALAILGIILGLAVGVFIVSAVCLWLWRVLRG